MLREALESLVPEIASDGSAEVVVVDNGSSDETRDVVAAFAARVNFSIIYHYEPCPGLHVGRHRGAELSRAPLLAYLDDDVIVEPGWLSAVVEQFASDPKIGLVGGPCRPIWEAPPPIWIDAFRREVAGGWCVAELSLIDLGADTKDIPPAYVFGCNYCVRKDVLYFMGGFHPDGMPDHLLRFRGDGENGLSTKIAQTGLRIVYDPRAGVGHRVPASRATERYFSSIARRNGVSTAYSLIRQSEGGLPSVLARGVRGLFVGSLRRIKNRLCEADRTTRLQKAMFFRQQVAFNLHMLRHYIRIISDLRLKAWVLRETYFDVHEAPYGPSSQTNRKFS